MPTYEYVCEKCGHQFEVFQSMTDEPLTVCPKSVCPQKKWGKGRVKRQLGTGAGLIFKGGGFYTTDYRSEKYKEAAKKDAPPSTTPATAPAGGESASASTKSETQAKPAKAKEAS